MSLELLTSQGRRKHLVPDSLTHSAGTITAIFGTKVYQTVISGLAANVRYQLYLIPNGTMIFSVNENSVGPAGQSSWLLVGAFYANAATVAAFGSFVNISGSPETETEITEPGVNQLTGFFAGFSAFTQSFYNWSRNGRHLFVTWRLDSVTGNGVSGRIPLPRTITSDNIGSGNVGTYAGQNGAANAGGGSMIGLGSSDVGFGGQNLSGSAISLQIGTVIVGTAPTTLVGSFRVHINQWSNIPLKDL